MAASGCHSNHILVTDMGMLWQRFLKNRSSIQFEIFEVCSCYLEECNHLQSRWKVKWLSNYSNRKSHEKNIVKSVHTIIHNFLKSAQNRSLLGDCTLPNNINIPWKFQMEWANGFWEIFASVLKKYKCQKTRIRKILLKNC